MERREVPLERSLEVQDPRSIPFTNPMSTLSGRLRGPSERRLGVNPK
jgi:hypothetical protein